MKRFLQRRSVWAFLGFAVADIICVGAGMGVPIFCILLGFPVGYAVVRSLVTRSLTLRDLLAKILRCAVLTSAFTFLLMLVIWMPAAFRLANPAFDVGNFGVPLILYDPLASFIGWLALMIVVSPFLQMLTTLFGAHLTLLWSLRHDRDQGFS
jgi:hypothetical protein